MSPSPSASASASVVTTQTLPVHSLNRPLAPGETIESRWAAERDTPAGAHVAAAAAALRAPAPTSSSSADITTTSAFNTTAPLLPVAFPTETVYGLGADATRSEAVRGIFAAKRRPADNPLIVHVASRAQLERLLAPTRVPPIYGPLLDRFWPGPLTVLLPLPPPPMPVSPDSDARGAATSSGGGGGGGTRPRLAPEVSAGQLTFGVRMPASPLARLLIHAADRPLAAPSANASTRPSPTAATHVAADLGGRIAIVLDGGSCQVGVESTVVDGLGDGPPAVLRPGGIGIDELRRVPGWEGVVPAYAEAGGHHHQSPSPSAAAAAAAAPAPGPRAPGMKYKHYSPRARVVLFEPQPGSDPEALAAAARARVLADLEVDHATATTAPDVPAAENAADASHTRPIVGIVRTRTWPPALRIDTDTGPGTNITTISDWDSPSPSTSTSTPGPISRITIIDAPLGTAVPNVARHLFAALRRLDEAGVRAIYVEGVVVTDNVGVGTCVGAEAAASGEELTAAVMNRLRKAAEERIVV